MKERAKKSKKKETKTEKTLKSKDLEVKEKIISEENQLDKKQEEKLKNKSFLIILSFMLFCILLFLGTYLLLGGSKSFTYKGILFSKYKYSNSLMLYSFPVNINLNNIHSNYTFFLREDPRKIKSSFNGTINLQKSLTINVNGNFSCDGEGIIAIANIQQLYQRININVYSDKNATCNSTLKNDVLLTIKQGDKTQLVQDKSNCYTVYIKDCEILAGTEQFIVETVAKLNSINKGLKVK